MSEITLSVVIPTFNSDRYLEACLASVRRELHSGVEFILVDGASSDQTMAIVENNRDLFAHIVSEPDRGQSDAFNKGYRLARGRYLTWLNSDDVLCFGAIAKALRILSTTNYEWLAANSVYLDADGYLTRCCRSGGYENFAVRGGVLNVFGPSTFFSKSLYEELGPIDESYHYCMDTEYWWRIVASGRRFCRMNLYFWGLRLHSDAKTASVILTNEMPEKMHREREQIAERYFPFVSYGRRSLIAKCVRLWRILNGAYPKAYWDTIRLRRKEKFPA